jgi:hypothetical protein
MICKMFRHTNPVSLRNLFFTSAVMAIFLLACTKGTSKQDWSVKMREAEHKTVQHPEKKYFAKIWPDGLQVSFHTAQGHFGSYTFPHKEFLLGEPAFLLCPGSPDLLPVRVVLINGANNDLNVYHDYEIEWLDKSPATAGETRVVRSY